MFKFLLRILVFILVPCLFVDSMMTGGFTTPSSIYRPYRQILPNGSESFPFEKQALAGPLTGGTRAHWSNARIWLIEHVPKPTVSRAIDFGRLQVGLSAIRRYSPERADWFKKNLRHVPHAEFAERLQHMGEQLNARLESVPSFGILWDEKPHKSKHWTHALFTPFLTREPDLLTYSDAAYLDEIQTMPPVMVIFDDCAVTGSQTLIQINEVLRRFPQTHFIVVIPYISDVVERSWRRKPYIELLRDNDGNLMSEVLPTFDGQIAAYFDHSTLDQASFPNELRDAVYTRQMQKVYRDVRGDYHEREKMEFNAKAPAPSSNRKKWPYALNGLIESLVPIWQMIGQGRGIAIELNLPDELLIVPPSPPDQPWDLDLAILSRLAYVAIARIRDGGKMVITLTQDAGMALLHIIGLPVATLAAPQNVGYQSRHQQSEITMLEQLLKSYGGALEILERGVDPTGRLFTLRLPFAPPNPTAPATTTGSA